MQFALRILAVGIPLGCMIFMSIMMERMFPGWIKFYYSFEPQSIGERFFLLPIIILSATAWRVPRHWLAYILLVELVILVPVLSQTVQMSSDDHAHPWLGLGGLYQLIWMLLAAIAGIVGRWSWASLKNRSR